MIVFKDYRGFEKCSLYVKKIDEFINFIEIDPFSNYSSIVSLFLEAAELETGITDTVSSEVDKITPLVSVCHDITNICAEMVYDIRLEKLQKENQIKLLKEKVNEFNSHEFPPLIPACIPEGFVFYGLYPEMFMEAAEKFYEKRLPEKIVCVGLRSIGTALSALVEVVLKKKGCITWSFTLRPKGHPFNRSVAFSYQIRERLEQIRDYWFLVIDEGPGLSGSSICGTLEKLLEVGIAAEKIVIFPSWNPDASRFISEKAKMLWPLFEKFTSDFSDVWIRNKKLEQLFKMEIVDDFSAGNWRDFVIEDTVYFPAVYSHHERRKYLLIDNQSKKYIAKWIGLGKYGNELLDRAKILADNDFCPAIKDSVYGFAISPFVYGNPLRHSDSNRKFFEFAADYFCCISNKFPSRLTASFEKMNEMVHLNVIEAIGIYYDKKLKDVDLFPKNLYEFNVVSVDGRVMPHEWLWTGDRYYKVDQLEHHCDQFFPGCQNIAWDIAAFCIEFNLNKKAEDEFLSIYLQKSGDTYIYDRITFYRIAYLAFRLGYVSTAADSLWDSTDGDRFRGEVAKYKNALINELGESRLFMGRHIKRRGAPGM